MCIEQHLLFSLDSRTYTHCPQSLPWRVVSRDVKMSASLETTGSSSNNTSPGSLTGAAGPAAVPPPSQGGLRLDNDWVSPTADSPLSGVHNLTPSVHQLHISPSTASQSGSPSTALQHGHHHSAPISAILPWLFVGQASAVHIAALNDDPIIAACSHLLCCCDREQDQPPPELLGMTRYRCKKVPFRDGDAERLEELLNSCCEFIEQGRRSCKGVVVYCQRGISRSASVVIYYLMVHEHMTYEAALKTVRQRRPQTDPSADFVLLLQRKGKYDGSAPAAPAADGASA